METTDKTTTPEQERIPDWKVEKESDIQQAVGLLCHQVNARSGEEARIFVDALLHQHRTLQQSFWRMLFNVILLYGQEARHDLRNDASVENCQKIGREIADFQYSFPFV